MLAFSTKANTLHMLQSKLSYFKVLPQVSFTVEELQKYQGKIEKQILIEFGEQNLIVRSSTVSEDTANNSMAGKFLTMMQVCAKGVLSAARQVMDSFTDDNPDNQILVQPMLSDIIMSGVLFTVDPNTGGNYIIINYDETSGSTDSVTSGEGKNLSMCYIFHGKQSGDVRLNKLCLGALECMKLFGQNNIDIESAFTGDGTLYLLQARPLVLKADMIDFKLQSA